MNKTLIALAVLVLVSLGGVYAYTSSLQESKAPDAQEEVALDNALGSAGPVSAWPYECHSGICTYYNAAPLRTATNTPCAIQSPAATSTLGSAVLRLDTASTSATSWDIAVSSFPNSTTTPLGSNVVVGAGARAYIVGSTTVPAGIIPPNSYVVFGARQGITAGDTAGAGFVPSGVCRATFTTTNF